MLQIKNTLGGGKPEGLYVWKKCENDTDHTFIDYVVSDKETAYPDGGEKGGYWYERVVEGAKISSGSFTFSTERDKVTINHGLNAVPSKFIIMQYSERAESGNYDVLGYSIIDGTKMFLSNKNDFISNVQAISENGTFVLDSTMLTIPKSYTSTSKQDFYKYRWQGTYTWIAIAE